jgi:hypothetical protein
MPNDCFNYVKITIPNNRNDLVELFMNRQFVPDEYFQPDPDDDITSWCYENFGTDRFYENDALNLRQHPTGHLEGEFQTAWNPPVQFYRRLVEKYPEIEIYFEYNEYMMGFCGYGTFNAVTYRQHTAHTHLTWETPEELETIQDGRVWIMTPWDPHYDANHN